MNRLVTHADESISLRADHALPRYIELPQQVAVTPTQADWLRANATMFAWSANRFWGAWCDLCLAFARLVSATIGYVVGDRPARLLAKIDAVNDRIWGTN